MQLEIRSILHQTKSLSLKYTSQDHDHDIAAALGQTRELRDASKGLFFATTCSLEARNVDLSFSSIQSKQRLIDGMQSTSNRRSCIQVRMQTS